MGFYDQLAADYDQMIGFDQRLEKETDIFRKIFKRFPATRILDAGCGTGFHSVVISLLGKQVSAIDNSTAMLKQAVENARHWQVHPEFIQSDFTNLHRTLQTRYDAIFCLGNSFAHILTAKQRGSVLKNFSRVLAAQGYLFLQLLNYDKILKERPEIISVKESGHNKYTRSYRYQGSTVIFTIRLETPAGAREISDELYPLQSDELLQLSAGSGFSGATLYGNLSFAEYDKYKSENICAVLIKQ